MKKIIAIVLILGLVSCSVSTTDNISIDPDDIQYIKDQRTGLCFGFVASKKAFDASASGLGMTCVPCESVEGYLTK